MYLMAILDRKEKLTFVLATTVNKNKSKQANVLITADRRINITKHCESFYVSHSHAYSLVQSLWITRMLPFFMKDWKAALYVKLLHKQNSHKSYIHQYKPESKRRSMEFKGALLNWKSNGHWVLGAKGNHTLTVLSLLRHYQFWLQCQNSKQVYFELC